MSRFEAIPNSKERDRFDGAFLYPKRCLTGVAMGLGVKAELKGWGSYQAKDT